MKIWIFNHYASTPDQPMTGAYYLAKALVDRGHEVSIFASSFSYYKRKEIRLKGLQLSKEESIDGIRFVWVKTFPNNSKMWSRSLNMVSYCFMSIFASLLRKGKPDIVVGTCPHLLGTWAAYFINLIKKSKFVFEVRDLWPQTFVDHGMISQNSFLTKVLRWLEKFLYLNASLIVTVLPYTYEYIEKVGINKNKVIWIPNGVDLSFYSNINQYDGTIGEEYTFMYFGGHAKYQGINTIIDAAKILQTENIKNVKFVFIGDGVEKQALINYANELKLKNVDFLEPVPRFQLQNYMNKATAFIFHLKKMEVLKYGMSPNKICDYLISGRPIICAVDSRNNPVKDAKAGLVIPPEDAVLMADAVKKIIALSPAERKAMGESGLRYALNNFNVKVLAEQYEKAIIKITGA